jgi:predicted sugar kinase
MIRVAFIATLAALPAAAAPRSIADCESIQAADAYNRCLASFGPVAAGHSVQKALPYAEPSEARASEMRSSDAGGGRVTVTKSRRGRARIVLTPRGAGD